MPNVQETVCVGQAGSRAAETKRASGVLEARPEDDKPSARVMESRHT